MDDTTYTAVYVPEYTGHHSTKSILKSRVRTLRRWWYRLSRIQKSFLFMVIMVLIIFCLILSSFSWVPEQNENNNLPLSRVLPEYNHLSRHNDDQLQPINIQVPVADNIDFMQQEQPLTNREPPDTGVKLEINPWDGLALAKDDAVGEKPIKTFIVNHSKEEESKPATEDSKIEHKVTLMSSSTEKSDLKSLIGEQTKENIRSIISLDPVIPLGPKKPKVRKTTAAPESVIHKSSMRHMKLTGPENHRQREVVAAFSHAWSGYKNYSWGMDHLQPISAKGQDWFGLGLTLIDSLDTLLIMGLNREFYEARDWVEDNLSFDTLKDVNLFETTIRVLGGLLSAHHLSGDQVFLTKAEELGSLLFVAFKTPSGIPYSDVNLRTKKAHGPQWNPDSTTSEVSTIQLEFRDLSRLTGNPAFEHAAMNVSHILHKQLKMSGLVPIYISPKDGMLRSSSVVTLGARGDSYYEYLLKQWIQTGKKIEFLRDDYLIAVEGIRDKLVRRTSLSNLTYIGELESGGQIFRPKMDHLVCYLPGTLALGTYQGLPLWHLELAKSLLHTCYLTYVLQPTGLAPEITHFKPEGDKSGDFYVKPNDAHNLLRPETVESLWYLHQITGNKMYQDWGWEIFQSFLKYTRVKYGFTSINSVLDPHDTRPRDMMESFFLAETLKYFYLLFSDKPIFDLNTVVFNTEAHPLPIYDS